MAYAEGTDVPFERSIAEMVALIKRSGGSQIGQMDDVACYMIQFTINERMIRFRLPLPLIDEMPSVNGRNQRLTTDQRKAKLVQATRSRARALLLVIKAKLESVASGIETVEQAFLANVVMADGATVYDRVSKPIALEYDAGRPNPALLGGPDR